MAKNIIFEFGAAFKSEIKLFFSLLHKNMNIEWKTSKDGQKKTVLLIIEEVFFSEKSF